MRSKIRIEVGLCVGALLGLAAAGSQTAPDERTGIAWERQAAVERGGKISWARSFEAAKFMAIRERKPILLLHLFGRLDEEFC